MEMTGEQRIPVGQKAVWNALNDPEVIKACVPGCESIEKTGENEYRLTVLAAVGPVRARFQGAMKMTDLKPPSSYNLVFEGQGGMAGFAKGDAGVELVPASDETVLKYTAKAQVGGKLAQVGSRMIDTAARKTADQFFTNFNARVTPGAGQAASPAKTTGTGTGTPSWVWAVGAVAVVAIVAAVYFLL